MLLPLRSEDAIAAESVKRKVKPTEASKQVDEAEGLHLRSVLS